eukprot:Phypoly_transcript_21486.p1 GENE.Phypoly_transcript_21486~~Phypoly_transcript_21486.p1  ORF type:complete len:156 (+),score=18.70 Phypoly_transcript_21486:64-468(+)
MKKIVQIQEKVFGSSSTEQELIKRLSLEKHAYISVAQVDGNVCGYVIGHEKKRKYYIWMLGVLGDYRGRGIATHLIKEQEEYAMQHFPFIGVKSSPKWKEMLRLLIKLDYIICGFKTNEWDTNSAIWFEKKLLK